MIKSQDCGGCAGFSATHITCPKGLSCITAASQMKSPTFILIMDNQSDIREVLQPFSKGIFKAGTGRLYLI